MLDMSFSVLVTFNCILLEEVISSFVLYTHSSHCFGMLYKQMRTKHDHLISLL